MKVKQVTDTSFRKYGKILTGIDFSEIYNVLEEMDYPEDIEYAASFGPLEEPEFRQKLSNTLYGELSVEIGYCSGHNKMLNALEYHRSSEANVAVTDIILLLGHQSDITEDFTYDTAQLEAFFVPAGTAVEDLNRTSFQQMPVLFGQRLCCDGFGGLLIPHTGDGKIFIAAHQLNDALDGIGTLVVDPAAEPVQLLLLFVFHIGFPELPILHAGVQQDLTGQLQDVVKQAHIAGHKLPVHKVGYQTNALDLTDFPDSRGNPDTVQPVQLPGKLFHIRELTGSSAEHLRNQGVHGRGLPVQLGEQVDAQTAGFKFVRGDASQPHPGQDLISDLRHCILSFIFCISSAGNPERRRHYR